VPGHGTPGSKADVAQFRQFLEWLASELESRVKEGKSLAQVKQELEPTLESRRWHAPEFGAQTVEEAFRQLAARTAAQAPPPPAIAPPSQKP
jgi:hypothetical protein